MEKFVEVAKAMGLTELCFLYTEKTKEFKTDKLKVSRGVVCKIKEISKFKKYDYYMVNVDGENIPKMIKNSKVTLFGFENIGKYDFMHHRNSGMNQVTAKLLTEYKKDIIVSFKENGEERRKEVKNICRKLGVEVEVKQMRLVIG